MGLRETAAELDAADPLAGKRGEFVLPEGLIYLDGNSLGPPPRAAFSRMESLLKGEWGRDLIASWNRHGWIDLPRRTADRIAPLIGAAPGEVAVADSTSVNLFKLIPAALRLNPGRSTILTERDGFPTDLYIAESAAEFMGGVRLRLVEGSEIEGALDEDVALVLLSHVNYRTGAMHDMRAINAAAHAKGALVLWDLAHSGGAVALDVARTSTDFAVGCGYKYLNGGPGAPAFLYVATRHLEVRQPLQGWFGHAAPFAFEPGYRPAEGVTRFHCGTPPVLSLAALDAALEVWQGVSLAAVRRKSVSLSDLFMAAVEEECAEPTLRLLTPRDPRCRGSQASYAFPEGYAVVQALIARGIVGDFRAPDIMRFGFAPLYLSHTEVWRAAHVLGDVLRTRAWDRPEYRVRSVVT